MSRINSNFEKLKKNYLFVDIQNKTQEFIKKNPDRKIIRMGIGDVTLPISETVTKYMIEACKEMSNINSFRGYGPYEGYEFLREAISNKYKKLNINISTSEIFVSDGAKSDVANILDIFDKNLEVLITDPVYPVYVDTNIIYGNNINFISANKQNNFLPLPENITNKNKKYDIIYICSPNNPTGSVYNKFELKKWVDFALKNNSIIIFDAAYECFINTNNTNLIHSIFEIENSKKCCIEICSFSKSAGFTGLRCAYNIIPKELKINNNLISDLWLRRQSIKFNGVSYVTQKGALGALSTQGQQEIRENIKYYKYNSKILSQAMNNLNYWHTGAENSPYIWFECKNNKINMTSWEFFDYLLQKTGIICTPGSGFGVNGEGYIRLSCFNSHENTERACELLQNLK